MQADLNRLIDKPPADKRLDVAATPKPIRAKTGLEKPSNGGSGITSPLAEDSRVNHAVQAVSSDGLFVWTVPETITMVDGAGTAIEFVYKVPVP